MYNRNDPRFRRTLNQISQNLETANEATQVGLFSFSEHYIKPCFGSIANAFEPCVATCFPTPDNRRRHRARSRARIEPNFDFYDDWEEDENDALLSLGNDEFDRLLGGNSTDDTSLQPARQQGMSYGSRGEGKFPGPRGRSAVLPYDGLPDPTIIPNQSRFGFFNKLPFKIGGKGLRYKPSAADLQERPRAKGVSDTLQESPEDEEEAIWDGWTQPTRKRSSTTGSGHTTDSYSSRGDLFPSDDEADAVPLDDEFAVALERRSTGDDTSSNKTRGSSRPRGTRNSMRTLSSRSGPKSAMRGRRSPSLRPESQDSESPAVGTATMMDLKMEEESVRAEEEQEIERKREAAQKLARARGLKVDDIPSELTTPDGKPNHETPSPSGGYFASGSSASFPFPGAEDGAISMASGPGIRDACTESRRSSGVPSESSAKT